MIPTLLRAVALTAVYLLVLTSLAPGDIVMGLALGLAVSVWLRPRAPSRAEPHPVTLSGAAAMLGRTLYEMIAGSWATARFCVGSRGAPGFVEIPREDRTRVEVAAWGVLTGEAPDEIVVDVDESRDVLIVHLLDASDPDAVQARHHRNHARLRGREAS